MSCRARRLLAASLMALWLPAWAQQLTLDEALRTAVARSQQLVAADASAAAVAEMAVSAGQLPDPVLRLGVENLPLSGPERFSFTRDFMTARTVGVMQELTRSDKRQLRVERLRQEGRRIEAQRRQTLAAVQRETALAWIRGRYALATVQLLQRQVDESQLQIEAAAVAFRAGRGSQADVFAARAALAGLQDRLRLAQREAETARLMLARWIGAGPAALPVQGAVPWQDTPAGAALLHQLEALPALSVLAAQVAAAETEVRQAEANLRPDISVEASYGRRGPAFSDMFSVGVSIPLPIATGRRQDREVASRLASLDEARARLEDARAAEEASLRVLLSQWQAGTQRLQRLEQDLLPAARNRTQGALASYSAGKAELASVLGARSEELEALMQLLSLESETARTWAELHYAVPQEPAAGKDRP